MCKICFSEQIFTENSHWVPLLTVYPFHYQYGKFYIFLLVKDYLICPSSRVIIEMHTARDVNNQRCDQSQAVAANRKIVLYFQFCGSHKANSLKRCRFSTHASTCFLYSALQDHDLMHTVCHVCVNQF